MACALKATFARFKPHLSMVLAQICSAFLFFITEAAFNQGLNPYVYVTYRLSLAGLLMFPFAYFLERKSRPKLTLRLFLELFSVSLLGIALSFNMLFASMRCTSPTFVTAASNNVPSLTFVIAILFRLEVVDVKSPRGIAKILGTLISLAGVTTITLYKGPALQSLRDAPIHIKRVLSIRENWVKGSILTIASCMTWSSWYIMQAFALKKYPAQLSLTAWIDCLGGAQSAVFAVFLQHKPAAWSITMFSINFWAIIYSGIVGTGFIVFLQLWCVKEKGPVFATVFNPLQTVTVAVLAYFVFGEKLHTGSVLGGVTVIIGLYLLLWGKERDQCYTKSQKQSSSHCDVIKVTDEEEVASAEKEGA
ncbi:PREDICTED: WAT1-related protein At1g43650 [Theobroma cacao]|uniref:WAT1-related protein n=1 Tax=Theobroma cacao TaxID=3641 RepID=A0AB32WFP1_THECC|nr:PREDICTED: WAT1-related protein At1g43650 [Theobroma cacao]